MIEKYIDSMRESFKRQLEKIPAKDRKILSYILIAMLVIILAYLGVYIFTERPTSIETEIGFSYVREEYLHVKGFAVRDEYSGEGGTNNAVLLQNPGKYYVPVVEDGENVGVRNIIAYAFDSEKEASDYIEYKKVSKELDSLTTLKTQIDLTGISVSHLNASIYSSVNKYVNAFSDKRLDDLRDISTDFVYKSSTKQLATGKNINIDSKINELKTTLSTLKANIGSHSNISTTNAGHFSSFVDGYEGTKLFSEVVSKNVANGEGEKLIKSSPSDVSPDAYGKIIFNHNWFFIFDTTILDASEFTTGGKVSVSFPEAGVKDVEMTVYYISELMGDKLTVVLKSTRMTDKIARLRIEEAEIKTVSCKGIRIDRDALTTNDEGITSVYVIRGRRILLVPLTVLYYGDDYVIAQSYTPYTTNEDGEQVVDEEKIKQYSGRMLKLYDKIIVGGGNIKDGEVIG